jgi:molecular chaperone DnaJ
VTKDEAAALLEVPAGAAEDVVREAWKKKAQDKHPDTGKPGASADAFNRITKALNILIGKDAPGTPVRGADATMTLPVTLLQAFKGGIFKVPGIGSLCTACAGQGWIPANPPIDCPTCGGDCYCVRSSGLIRLRAPCDDCGGKGQITKKACPACHGTGGGAGTPGFKIQIPKGARDGEVFRQAGCGYPGTDGGGRGDMQVVIRLEQHPRFRVKDSDLLTNHTVPFIDACSGGEALVEGVEGKPVRMIVPKGTQSGTVIKVPHQGMPRKNGTRGDLYVRVLVGVPDEVTPVQRLLLKVWRMTDRKTTRA